MCCLAASNVWLLFKGASWDVKKSKLDQALSGTGFTEGENHNYRTGIKKPETDNSPQTISQMQAELLYLRQEVEFLKKIITADNSKKKQ